MRPRPNLPVLDDAASGDVPVPGHWLERVWAGLPEWVLTMSGVLFLLLPLLAGLADYRHWETLGPYYRFADGRTLQLPWVRVLGDWTAVLVLVSFCVRLRPLRRNSRLGDVAIGLLGSTWLYAPFVVAGVLALVDRWDGTRLAVEFRGIWMSSSLSLGRTLGGSALILAGNALDVWGYAVLLRSFSQTPEARVLRTKGPYRLIRHPVYFGQILAQSGVYLCFAVRHVGWVLFWAAFCAIQLRRAWREEQVLEAAFGTDYLRWKRRTFWFW